ncbi:hypothetical protein ACJMK2_039747 [Sinanodonta woodiana]|uniref:Amine oxidase n=1 Tax=Sinanodonta woodiana TaxID=1069815 RepID=A0ABD3WCY0_SINWO
MTEIEKDSSAPVGETNEQMDTHTETPVQDSHQASDQEEPRLHSASAEVKIIIPWEPKKKTSTGADKLDVVKDANGSTIEEEADDLDHLHIGRNFGVVTFSENSPVKVNGSDTRTTDKNVSDSVDQQVQKSKDRGISTVTLCVFLFISIGAFVLGILIGILTGMYGIGHKGGDSNSYVSNINSTPSTNIEVTPNVNKQVTVNITCPQVTLETRTQPPATAEPNKCKKCEIRSPFIEKTVQDLPSPFMSLTVPEMASVSIALLSKGIISGTVNWDSNYITNMYLFPTPKTETLDYLDSNRNFPGRYAFVIVYRAARSPPDVMEYKVGPLNVTSAEMITEKLRLDDEISFNRRPFDVLATGAVNEVAQPHLDVVRSLLQESFDGAYFGNGMGNIISTAQNDDDEDRKINYLLYLHAYDSETMRVIPFSFNIHCPGVNTSEWYASDFYYLSQGPYSSSRALMEAYNNGTLRKFKFPKDYRASTNRQYAARRNSSLPLRDEASRVPPRTYEPAGPRYKIRGNKINWMGWYFEFASNPVRGPVLNDIRFMEERIIYELALQDTTLLYASGQAGPGNHPGMLSDMEFNLGVFDYPVPDLDCPEHAALVQTTYWDINAREGREQVAACVFEADGQGPLWRHKGSGGLRDNFLVLRFPINLGNYDYLMDFRFHLNGMLDVNIAATGYLYASFWDPEDPLVNEEKSTTAFGFRISDFMNGNIHDHSFLFKVDLDVAGRSNSLDIIRWKTGDVMTAVNSQTKITKKPLFFPFNYTRYIQYETILKEIGLVSDPLNPSFWTIVNENKRNRWGNKRGYRIYVSSNAAEKMPDLHPPAIAWSHLKFQCAVTQQKDTEKYGTESLYDMHKPKNPLGGIDYMLDGEDIKNKDLVAWVTARFLHVPTSEDVPMTARVDSGFILKPFNFLDRTALFDMPQHVIDRMDIVKPHELEPCYENIN